MDYGTLIFENDTKKIYRNGDKLIKIFNSSYSQSKILSEALNQSYAVDLKFKVPKVHEVCKMDDHWVIISEYIEGITMEQYMMEHPDKKSEMIDKLVDLQLYVNSKSSTKLYGQYDKFNHAICKLKLDAVTRFELHDRLGIITSYTNVCHGDFIPSNIVITPNNEYYILDWSSVTQGNPKYDYVTTYILLEMQFNQEIADEYLNNVISKTNGKYDHETLLKYVPLVSAILAAKSHDEETRKQFLELFLATDK